MALPSVPHDDDGSVRRFADRLAAGGLGYAARRVRGAVERERDRSAFHLDESQVQRKRIQCNARRDLFLLTGCRPDITNYGQQTSVLSPSFGWLLSRDAPETWPLHRGPAPGHQPGRRRLCIPPPIATPVPHAHHWRADHGTRRDRGSCGTAVRSTASRSKGTSRSRCAKTTSPGRGMPRASPPRRNWTASTPSEPAFSPTPSTPTRPSTPTNGHAECSSSAPQDLKTWEFSRQILGPNGASISLGEKDPTQGGSRHRTHSRPCPRAPVPVHAGLRSGLAPAAEVGADAVRRRRSRRSQGPEGLAGGKGRSPGCRQATGASQDHRDRANRAQLAHPARRSRHPDQKRSFPPRGAGQPFTLFARPASLQEEAFQPLGIEPAESDSSKAAG